MKSTSLCALLVVGACASSGEAPDCELPGDIDCAPAPAGGDGKADGWDYKNDPARLASNLNYRLAELPRKGDRTTPAWQNQYPEAVGVAAVAWADTYWPTAQGSHNNRWLGETIKSPLEKYDAAFNEAPGCETYPASFSGETAKAAWDAYNACAGPAAKWQSNTFQDVSNMHDGIDNDGDGAIDSFGDNGFDGVAGWWGTCHAWSPAALLVPEPQYPVTIAGQTFEVGDIKALAQNMYDSTASIALGGRCNAREIVHDATGSANLACSDVNAGAMHVILANYLGIANLPLVEDRTQNYEVWNQPVMGYEVTALTEVTAEVANACVGASGTAWAYNADAASLREVRTTVKYLTEGAPSLEPIGSADYLDRDDYHYILELSAAGKIIGGRYCADSENTHIDFLWAPTGQHAPRNPHVSSAKVNELIAKSLVRPTGGGGPARVFTGTGGAIPDGDEAGASVAIAVTGVAAPALLSVTTNITHSYRGDLRVSLYHDGVLVKTLANRIGGGEADLARTFLIPPDLVGPAPDGTWTLEVVDVAQSDTGAIGEVSLRFE